MNKSSPTPVSPGAKLNWAWDWSAWLEDGDAIQSHEITVDAGLTLVGTSTAVGAVISCVLQVAADIAQYQAVSATCRITTTAGLIDSRAIYMLPSQQ